MQHLHFASPTDLHSSFFKLLFAVGLVLASSCAWSATFNVTSNLCGGPGSIRQAVADANANSGPDVIEFTPGLQVEVSTCPGPPTSFFADVTDDVIFEGNGAKLIGQIQWVTSGGLLTPLNNCPATATGTLIVTTTPGFLRVADGKSVEVKNLSVKEVHSIANVRNNASLLLEDFKAERVLAFADCSAEPVAVGDNANLTLRRNTWDTVVTWPGIVLPPTVISPAIMTNTNAGNLVIEDSTFYKLVHGNEENSGLFYWDAPVGKTVKIVSSRMNETGGIVALGGVDTFIVNSAWVNATFGEYASVTDRFVNASTGTMTIAGSTIMAMGVECDQGCQADPIAGIPDSNGMIRALDGHIDLVETAIGVNLPDDKGTVLSETPISPPFPSGGGDIRADARTWIQPDVQTAAELKAISNQPGLLTDAPGLIREDAPSSFAQFVSPLLGTPGNPGKLIDVIADGCTSGKLVNPIDGSTITTDVFGNPRCDANGRRNIGAVQTTLAPQLAVNGTGDALVSLGWSRPKDPDSGAINGYEVCHGTGAPPDPLGIGTACPGTLVPFAGDGTLTGDVTGLTNGTAAWFLVRGVNPDPGPWSNLVTATPKGPIGVPVLSAVAGFHEVKLTWAAPDSGGHDIDAYVVDYRKAGSPDLLGTFRVSAIEFQTTLTRLEAGQQYEFTVMAIATDGTTSERGIARATPFGDVLAPVVETASGKRSVNLSWNVPESGGRAICYYVVLWRPANLGDWPPANFKFTSDTQALIDGLDPAVAYQFGVAAVVEKEPGSGCGVAVSGPLGYALAAPLLEPATFRVSKSYSDGSNYPVEVELSCNSGLFLDQSDSITPDRPVTFVLTDFTSGFARCEVTESGGPEGYVPRYYNGMFPSTASCVFDTVLSGGAYTCDIMNTADNAMFTIRKHWVLSGEGFEEASYEVRVDVACSADILFVDGQPVADPDGSMTVFLGDGESRVLEVDTLTGSANCTATETVTQSGVESSSEGCTSVPLTAGASAECTFTNTVFFEGIPVLDRYSLALLALLTLGIGLVGFRRMM